MKLLVANHMIYHVGVAGPKYKFSGQYAEDGSPINQAAPEIVQPGEVFQARDEDVLSFVSQPGPNILAPAREPTILEVRAYQLAHGLEQAS